MKNGHDPQKPDPNSVRIPPNTFCTAQLIESKQFQCFSVFSTLVEIQFETKASGANALRIQQII